MSGKDVEVRLLSPALNPNTDRGKRVAATPRRQCCEPWNFPRVCIAQLSITSYNKGMSMATNIPGMMTVDEAAPVIGICNSLVSRYCKEGRFKDTRRVGPMWLIPEDEVFRFKETERLRGNPMFRKRRRKKKR